MKLYEIPQEFAVLEDLLIEGCGELTAELEEAAKILENASQDKIEAAVRVVKTLEAEAEVAKAEAARIMDRAKARENAADRLRALIVPALESLGGKLKTPLFTVGVQTRKSYAFALTPGHEAFELDTRFWRQPEPQLNKTELKKAVEAGETLPTFLHTEPTTTTFLSIR